MIPSGDAVSEILRFLQAIYGEMEGYTYIWLLKKKKTLWRPLAEHRNIAEAAVRLGQFQDIYFPVCPQVKVLSGNERGTLTSVYSMTCLYCDIDCKGGYHKQKNLPTFDEAWEWLESLPYQPSIIIFSGGGMHCYWLFDKPWIFESKDDRQKAQDMSRLWQQRFIKDYAERGWKLDNTSDLTRVLRLPGTMNCKGDTPIPVRILVFEPERKYNIQQLVDMKLVVDITTKDSRDSTGGRDRVEHSIFNDCAFLRHCRDDAETLAEPEWYAAISVLARLNKGVDLAHNISQPYPNYNRQETDRKILHAMNDAGPATCQRIRVEFPGYCEKCTKNVKSPVVLASQSIRLTTSDKSRQGKEAKSVKQSQADILLELINAIDIEVFHDSASATYIRFPVKGHTETWPTKAKAVKLWLSGQFYQATGKAISPDALRQALGVLEAKARFEGLKIELSLRVAERDGAFWYDLANDDWQAIKIEPGSWKIVDKPLPLFSKAANTAAQVIPERVKGTEILKVLDLVNLSDEGQKLLFIVELISCLIPGIPHAVAIWHDEKGASKSTVMKIRRKLIDPAIQELQLMPKDTSELALLLSKNWMPSFDNLDGLSGTVSDILCVAATGGGISKRELYTDSDEIILSFRRCISLNGINEPATRPDLLDRAILFELRRISEDQRISESEFWRSFEEVRPKIIGAMFQVLADAMKIYQSVKLNKLPRMADFAKWGYAIGEALYQGGGEKFINAFEANRQSANDEALTGNPVAIAIVSLMNSKQQWAGTAGDLLVVLNQIAYGVGIDVKAWSWPRSAKGLAKRLKQVRSNLAEAGIRLNENYDSHTKQKKYLLESSFTDNVFEEDDFLT